MLWLWERHIVLELNLLSDSSSSLSDWSVLRSQDVPTSPALLYGIVSGYYFQGIYVSLYVEERRKDTLVMVIHHFVTLFLVSFSFGMRLWKIGVLVLFCHDLWNRFNLSSEEVKNQLMTSSSNRIHKSDVCLHLSKICLYIQNEAKSEFRKQLCEIGKTIGFASFIISWVLFRFVYFPKKTWFNALVRR